MSAERGSRAVGRAWRVGFALTYMVVSGCSWFTDFKEQPKIDPWDSASDSVPPRANPQGSIPITGSVAPLMLYSRGHMPAVYASMAPLANPVPADSASVNNGRKLYQVNCAVCHGAGGQGHVLKQYGINAANLVIDTALSKTTYTDGFLFAVIRNGIGNMPSYGRIEDGERWDIINYLRSLQGKGTVAADTSHGRPGETGSFLPRATSTAPTRPAPHFRTMGPTPRPATPPGGAHPPAHTPPDTTKGA